MKSIVKTLVFITPAVLLAALPAFAKLNVVATITDLAALTRAIGGDHIDVESIAKGTQDPHAIEAKPSYMVKLSKADLVVANGLALEIGWLPNLLQGARRPNIKPGNPGYLEIGPQIEPIEVRSGGVSRAEGDVHPEGNPHFTLDPVRLEKAADIIAAKLTELDPANKADYEKNAKAFRATMDKRLSDWKFRVEKLPSKKLVTHHATFNYLLDRFGLKAVTVLEPKPGVPPSPQHILEVIKTMKAEGAKIILVENYFDPKTAERVAQDVPGASVASVGPSVESSPDLKSSIDVIDSVIVAIEQANIPGKGSLK